MKRKDILQYTKRYAHEAYLVFRILIGGLFFMHGAQKVLGWFGGAIMPLTSQTGFAGVIEVVVGLAIVFGFWTRIAALLGGLEMLAAYFVVHSPNGLNPLMNTGNGGELTLLYLAGFLVLAIYGPGKWSIEDKR